MQLSDLLEETYLALVGNKVRSSLTVLGIVIGIASVIAMVAIGQGSQASIQASIQSIGSNLIAITPGAQRGVGQQVSAGRGSSQTLTAADASAIQAQVSSVSAVAPDLTKRYQVTAPGTNTNTQVIGTTPAYLNVRNIAVDQGSFFTDQDVTSMSKVVVIGPTARDDLFGQGSDAIGKTLRINNISFLVIGITQSKGGTGFANPDDAVYVPLTTAQHFLAGVTYVSTISVSAVDQQSMSTVQQAITTLLLQRHNISNPQSADFSILNQNDIVSTASSVTGTFTALLASVAAISLVVGGIGIMNMMLTTVTERTREIGLRKAIGAERNDISNQFLMEAVALTFSGGILGIILGWIVTLLVEKFASIHSQITLSSVLMAFGVSAAIGVVFGYYPARRASGLNPIEALRYE